MADWIISILGIALTIDFIISAVRGGNHQMVILQIISLLQRLK